MTKETLKIDVVSDVACPWCYVGKRRLEKALEQWNGAPIEVTWHPYQLDPTMPAEGQDRTTYLTQKFGAIENAEAMTQRLVEVGADEGITFNFGEKWLAVNTLPLHQLLQVAGEEGFREQLKERFLKAYFEENLHLNQPEVLESIMAEFGWNAEKTKVILADEQLAYIVKQEIAHYQQMGVSGVPFFIINERYGFSGAQPVATFLQAFEQVAATENLQDGEHCDPATKEC